MNTRSEAIDLLKRSPLFSGMQPSDLVRVAAELSEMTYQQGQLILGQGDLSSEVHFVLEGRVRLAVLTADGRAVAFRHATVGDMFGEIAAFDGGPRTADATALSRVKTLVLSRAALRQLMSASPLIAETAIGYLCGRLRATSAQLQEVALHPVEVRLARFLLHIAKLQDNGALPAVVALDVGMSQSELAQLIGTSRQTANAALTMLEKQGAVKRNGQRLECDLGLLTRAAVLE